MIHIPFIVAYAYLHFRSIMMVIENTFGKKIKWLEGDIIKMISRKLVLLYIVLSVSTLAAFLPPIINWLYAIHAKNIPSFSLLGSTEWVTITSLLVTTYFGVNHMDNRLSFGNTQIQNNDIFNPPSNQKIITDEKNEDSEKEDLKKALTHDKL